MHIVDFFIFLSEKNLHGIFFFRIFTKSMIIIDADTETASSLKNKRAMNFIRLKIKFKSFEMIIEIPIIFFF